MAQPFSSRFVGVLCLTFAVLTGCTPEPQASAAGAAPPVVSEATIAELQAAMEEGIVTSASLVDAFLARIAAYDLDGPRLNAVIRLNPEARAQAAALDRERLSSGPRGPLHGIPVLLKDNYDTHDMPTAASSVALAGLVPPDDAFQVRKLREAGAVILGKTNMHELAMGITTISSLGGQTRNPYDPDRNPGGSSGGTGAAIAASFAVAGWGSDTCGSIRIPASQNNLFGLRPTKGLSSIDGIIPLSHSQDTGGPLARTATDLAITLDATIGADPADPATAALAERELPAFVEALDAGALRGARIGVLRDGFGDEAPDRAMGAVVERAIEDMRRAGAVIVDSVVVPDLAALTSGAGVINYEFKFDFMDYLAATPGAPVSALTEILDQGAHHVALTGAFRRREAVEERGSAEYVEALGRRTDVRRALTTTLDRQRLDAFLYPTMRRPAARIGDPQQGSNCQWSAISGLPALSVPAGFTAGGLPVGLELMGRGFDDARLVAMGFAFEQATDHRRAPHTTPPLVGGRAPEAIRFQVMARGEGGEAEGRFTYDATTSTLAYEVSLTGQAAAEAEAVTLRRPDREVGEDDPDDPDDPSGDSDAPVVVHRLAGPGQSSASGSITLNAADRAALWEGAMIMSVHTTSYPMEGARGTLSLPRPGAAAPIG